MAHTPGELTFAINRKLVGQGVAASDEEVARRSPSPSASSSWWSSRAARSALAALLAGKLDVEGKIAVAMLSGGNVDPELFSRLVARSSRCRRYAACTTTDMSPTLRRAAGFTVTSMS